MSKIKMSGFTWSEILSDPALKRLVHRLNKRYPYMAEDDLLNIVNDVANALRVRNERLK